MVKTSISGKGQTTVPYELRKKWKTTRIVWQTNDDGSAMVRPAPTARSLFGIASNGKPRDSREMEKANKAVADDARKKGPRP